MEKLITWFLGLFLFFVFSSFCVDLNKDSEQKDEQYSKIRKGR